MIGRTHRFHGRASIQRLYKTGKSVRTNSFALRYQPNPRRSTYRAAVVVSRKISKSAVVRNRIRRRVYEAIRQSSANFAGAHDIAVVVYDEKAAIMPALELLGEIDKLLQKAKLTSADSVSHGIVEPKEN